jgi:hypothetical protein
MKESHHVTGFKEGIKIRTINKLPRLICHFGIGYACFWPCIVWGVVVRCKSTWQVTKFVIRYIDRRILPRRNKQAGHSFPSCPMCVFCWKSSALIARISIQPTSDDPLFLVWFTIVFQWFGCPLAISSTTHSRKKKLSYFFSWVRQLFTVDFHKHQYEFSNTSVLSNCSSHRWLGYPTA